MITSNYIINFFGIIFFISLRLIKCLNENDIIVGKSLIDIQKKEICEHYGNRDIFSSDIYSKICIVPKDGLHGIRYNDQKNKKINFSFNNDKLIKNKLNNYNKNEFSKYNNKRALFIRKQRKLMDLESLFNVDKDLNFLNILSKISLDNNSINGTLYNETNNLALFKQGLVNYKEQKLKAYYLYDESKGEYIKKIVYPEGVLSHNSAFNYLGNQVNKYVISSVSEPAVLAWPANHIVLISSQVNKDGSFKLEVRTLSEQTGFYFSISNNQYITGCGSYKRVDGSNFFHIANTIINVELVRRKFGFNVFIDGTRRPKLDIIDCLASVPTSIEVISGTNSLIYPAIEDCKVSQWTSWSACSKTCSTGTKVRYRSLIMPRMNGGLFCPDLIETSTCNVDIKCSPCQYSSWSMWSECSSSCGTGTSMRTRELISTSKYKESCIETSEVKSCKESFCATDCIVTEWSQWSECSTTCNTGSQFSTRSVVKSESNGGSCDFELSRTQNCNVAKCLLPCDPNPCLNRGTCTELPMSNFICTCLPFYDGTICDKFILPWWVYYIFIVVGFLILGIFYKLFISNILVLNSMDPNYGINDYVFDQSPEIPVVQNDGSYLVNNNDDYNWAY